MNLGFITQNHALPISQYSTLPFSMVYPFQIEFLESKPCTRGTRGPPSLFGVFWLSGSVIFEYGSCGHQSIRPRDHFVIMVSLPSNSSPTSNSHPHNETSTLASCVKSCLLKGEQVICTDRKSTRLNSSHVD